MKDNKKNRTTFRPSLGNSSLEDRTLLASGAYVTIGSGPHAIVYRLNPTTSAPAYGVTPVPASSTSTPGATTSNPTVGQLRATYTQQVQAAATILRTAVFSQVNQLYAKKAVPTAQQIASLKASIGGLVDAAASQLSTQAALLPGSASSLVPSIQNALVGSGASSLHNRLAALIQAQSGRVS